MSLHYLNLLAENKRPKIFHGIETIVERFPSEPGTSVMVPPRYGKADIIRGSALELIKCGAVTSVVIVPWIYLADQIKDEEKVRLMYERYAIPVNTPFFLHRCIKMRTSRWWKRSRGLYNLISMTIGLANANDSQFFDGLEEIKETYGVPVPVFIDECHLVRKNQAWSNLALKAQELGCYIVPLTGTPVLGMPEFEQITDDWKKVTYTLIRKKLVNGELQYSKQTYEGQSRQIVQIRGQVHVDWKTAWDEGALSKVNAIWIDTKVIDSETDEELGMLSQLTKEELRGRLRAILESNDLIAKASAVGVKRLLRRRHGTRMLVVTGFDYGDFERNSQANHFKQAIRQALISFGRNPDLFRIAIATTTDDEGFPDAQALQKIKDFQAGKIDILIVKMMALVGLDVPECKIEIYNSPMCDGALPQQALSRALTIWEEERNPADLIMVDHIGQRNAYNRMVRDQGGEAETKVDLTQEEPIPPPEEASRLCYVKDSGVSRYADQYGKQQSGDHEITLEIIKHVYNVGNLTDAEILENYQRGGFIVTEQNRTDYEAKRQQEEAQGFKDVDKPLEDIIGEFGNAAKRLVSKHVNYGISPDHWREKVRELQTKAKELCGIWSGSVTDLDDAELLKRLIDALPEAEKLIFR